MKRLFVKLSLLMVIVTVITALIIKASLMVVSTVSFKIPEEKDIIVTGDSLPEAAVDDSIFTRSFNFAAGGEPYFYTYSKVKKLFAANSHIRFVLAGFWTGNLRKAVDDMLINREHILRLLPTHFFMMERRELQVLAANDPLAFAEAFVKIPVRNSRGIVKYFFNRGFSFIDIRIGGFWRNDADPHLLKTSLAESDKPGSGLPAEAFSEEDYSIYQIEYLFKILELCRDNNAELIFFNTPLYHPPDAGDTTFVNECYNRYFKEKGIRYLDFSLFPMPEEGFGDLVHLNYKGAAIFSRYLEEHGNDFF